MRKSEQTIRMAVRRIWSLSEEQFQAFRNAARFLGSRYTAELFPWDS